MFWKKDAQEEGWWMVYGRRGMVCSVRARIIKCRDIGCWAFGELSLVSENGGGTSLHPLYPHILQLLCWTISRHEKLQPMCYEPEKKSLQLPQTEPWDICCCFLHCEWITRMVCMYFQFQLLLSSLSVISCNPANL